ncbi:hypothetical protein BDAP_000748 [Binucleata daphniae]
MLSISNENNSFKLFGILPTYNIDKVWLKKKYYDLCKKHHPDISNSQLQFHEIKKAYNILQNDRLRAIHLNDIKKQKNDVQCNLDAKFLMEILDYEEKINNGCTDEVKKELDKRIAECKNKYDDPEYIKNGDITKD